jgi:hypothetical protein
MKLANKLVIPGITAFAAVAGLAGGNLLNALPTSADSTTSSTTSSTQSSDTSSASDPADAPDPTQGGHVGQNGTKEELLTGDTASKAKAAALAAVPGASVDRVENDAEGATYEAHLTKSDGSHVTVKLDANFKVTSTESGPDGHGGPGRPSDSSSTSQN